MYSPNPQRNISTARLCCPEPVGQQKTSVVVCNLGLEREQAKKTKDIFWIGSSDSFARA